MSSDTFSEKIDKRFKTPNQIKDHLISLKWYNTVCFKCGGNLFIDSTVKYIRKCSTCHHPENILDNTIFNNVKFGLVKAFKMYQIVVNNPNVKTIDLSNALNVRRQTCSTFKQRIIENNFEIIYDKFVETSSHNNCLYLLLKLLATKSNGEKHLNQYLSLDHYNKDKSLVSLIDALVVFLKNENRTEITDRDKFTIYKNYKKSDIIYSDFLNIKNGFKKDLERRFDILSTHIENFILFDELIYLRTDITKDNLSNKKTNLKKFTYSVFLEKELQSSLEQEMKQDVRYLEQQLKQRKIRSNFFDLKYYNELVNLKQRKLKNFKIATEENIKNLTSNLFLTFMLRTYVVAAELYKFGLANEINNFVKNTLNECYEIHKNIYKTINDISDEPTKEIAGVFQKLTEIFKNVIDEQTDKQKSKRLLKMFGIFVKNYQKIYEEYIADILIVTVEFCKTNLQKKNSIDYKDLYDLIIQINKSNITEIDGFINKSNLKYLILICCKNKKIKEAKMILYGNIDKIEDKYRNDVLFFNEKIINYYDSNVANGKAELIQCKFDPSKLGIGYQIGWYLPLVKAKYDLDEVYNEKTLHLYDDSSKFLKMRTKDSIILRDKKACLNFIEILKELYAIKFEKLPKTNLDALKRKLNRQDLNVDRFWLTDEINKLKK